MARGLISGTVFEPARIAIVNIRHTNFSYILLVNDEIRDFDFLYEYAGGVRWYRRDDPDNYDEIRKSIKTLFGDLPVVQLEHATDYLNRYEDLDDMSVLLFGKSLDELKFEEIKNDIRVLISRWFAALEDEGVNPWRDEECVAMANKYQYTTQDYQDFLRTLS